VQNITDMDKTITYFKVTVLCFGILLFQSCIKTPDFYLLDGSGQQLQDYRGKWLIVNFWAEWCSPCREEVPDLNQLYKLTSRDELAIIGISYDRLSNDVINQIVSDWVIEYPVIASDPMPILPFKLPKSLPGNYIFNPDGELVAKLSGKQTYDSLSKLLKTLKKKSR